MNEVTRSMTLPPDSGPAIQINDQEFNLLRTLVYDNFGINLTEQKRSLVVGRLHQLLRNQGFKTFREYYDFLVRDKSHANLTELINRISTNYSFFYREKAHFDFFVKTALPEVVAKLQAKNTNDLRIWTAGCSTGEEPYMLAMLMLDFFGNDYARWSGGILATDISDRALSFAHRGLYPEDRIKQVPPMLRSRYFIRQGDEVGVNDRIKKEVTFRRLNLMNPQFPFKKPFHMIFCRNVMIYFDKETRDNLVRKFHQITEPGGFLFIGHSETLGRDQDLYRYVMPATYQKI
ncbi:MAG: protein-glutamate O-methyltransferase [Desulfobulbaceae bacterium]|nr:protein-glutamate O-methyltransferase [Desulfobulbaceae bacterium]